jgi:hypothetical protein
MSDWSHEDWLDAARAIRPYLSTLARDHAARDKELARLLGAAKSGIDVELELIDALTRPELRAWTQAFLSGRRPPEIARTRFGIELTPAQFVDTEKWVCPHGDFDWYRFTPDERIPHCPTHDAKLVMAKSE